jgi:hypothetical protein
MNNSEIENTATNSWCESILDQNPAIQTSLNTILNNLLTKSEPCQENDILFLLKEILQLFTENTTDSPSFEELSQEQQRALFIEVKKIITELCKHGSFRTSTNKTKTVAYKILLGYLSFAEKKSKQQQEQLFLSKAAKEQIKKDLERHAIYEIYKFTNPRAIAGETKLENFISNVIRKGFEYALKQESAPEEMLKKTPKSFVKKLEKEHENFIKNKHTR